MMFFQEKWPLFGKIEIMFQTFHDDTDSRFMLKFHGNRPPGCG